MRGSSAVSESIKFGAFWNTIDTKCSIKLRRVTRSDGTIQKVSRELKDLAFTKSSIIEAASQHKDKKPIVTRNLRHAK